MGLRPPNQTKQEISESGEECDGGNSALEVNSMVQITLDKGTQVSGIIRWLGYLPQIEHKMAGVELVRSKHFLLGNGTSEWAAFGCFSLLRPSACVFHSLMWASDVLESEL